MMWLIWVAISVLALIGEALTLGLFLASLAVAALLVAPLSLVLAVPFQLLAFAALSLLVLTGVRPAVVRLLPHGDDAENAPRIGPLGEYGTVIERVDNQQGQVRIGSSEFWTARPVQSGTTISPGREVRIVRMDGLTAIVEPVTGTVQDNDFEEHNPSGLSSREIEVLRLVARGMSNQEIADTLFLSPRTVHHHVSHILTKMGVGSRMEAVRAGMEQGLVRLDETP